jgi:hypothetical protein
LTSIYFLVSVRLSATSRPVVVAINKQDIAGREAQPPRTTQQAAQHTTQHTTQQAAQRARNRHDSTSAAGASDTKEGEESCVEGAEGQSRVSGGDYEDLDGREHSGGQRHGRGRGRGGVGGAISLAAMTLPALRELWQGRLPNAGTSTRDLNLTICILRSAPEFYVLCFMFYVLRFSSRV